jgi:hypothetical protein
MSDVESQRHLQWVMFSIATMAQNFFKTLGKELLASHTSELGTDHPSVAACALLVLYRSMHARLDDIDETSENAPHSSNALVSKPQLQPLLLTFFLG